MNVHFSQGGPSIDSGGSWYESMGVNEVSAKIYGPMVSNALILSDLPTILSRCLPICSNFYRPLKKRSEL